MLRSRLVVMVLVLAVVAAACGAPSDVSASFACDRVIVNYQGTFEEDEAFYGIAVFLGGEGLSGTPLGGIIGPGSVGSHQVVINLGQTLPEGTQLEVYFIYVEGETPVASLEASGACRGSAAESGVFVPCVTGDNRVNSLHCASPVAIFCAGGNIDVYQVNSEDGFGTLVIRQPLAMIEGLEPAEDGENLTLAQVGNTILSRLSDGKYQINATYDDGKPYIITWNGCPATEIDILAW